MTLADLRAFARAYRAGTPGARDAESTCSRRDGGQTAEICGFHGAETPGTRGTLEMGNAGENASAAFNGPAPSPAEAPSLANKDEKADVRLRRFQPELDMIESMAEALAANADRKLPMDYFRNEARRRLATLKDPYARALLLGFERHRKPSGAKVCSDESFCRVAAGHAQCSDEGK